MEIQGKLLMLLPLQTGTSAKGDWKKQDAIIETLEQFPKKVSISFWGDKADELKIVKEGAIIKVSVNIESREYNGKWYTDVRAWKIEAGDATNPTSSQANNSSTIDRQHAEEPADLSPSDGAVDDLPF
jgi:hypothetical protein